MVVAAAAFPAFLIAGPVGAMALLVVIAAAIVWRGRRGERSDVILRASLIVGNAALVVGGAQLLFAAAGARSDNSLEVPEINAAVISRSYYPSAFKTPFHPSGVVVLEALTTDGADYLPDSAAAAGLARAIGAKSAESLMKSFREENAKSGVVRQVQRPFATQIVLDSVSAGRYLANPLSAEVPHDVASLSHGKQRLGVLGLSKPGIDSTGSVALVFARIRLPVTDTEPLLERASLLLVRKGASAWTIDSFWELAIRR